MMHSLASFKVILLYNALDQAWKEAPLDTDPDKDINYRYASYNLIPEHLLRAAGIPTDELTENSAKRQRRQPVWYAIEFDGPVRRQGLEKYHALIGQTEAMLQEIPDNQKLARKLESMRSALSERENGTRLFLVDFALEKDTLQQRYAAQSDILFLPGMLHFIYYNKDNDNDKTILQGHFDKLDNDSITIPSPWNKQFLSKDMPSPRYQAKISWGRLAESWIVTLSLQPGQKKNSPPITVEDQPSNKLSSSSTSPRVRSNICSRSATSRRLRSSPLTSSTTCP